MRRYVTFATVALFLLAAGAAFALLAPRKCPVTKAAVESVQEGMSPTEVHAILGVPPGDHRTRPDPRKLPPTVTYVARKVIECWEGDEGSATVVYRDTDGSPRVLAVYFDDAPSHASGLAELARWRLNRLGTR